MKTTFLLLLLCLRPLGAAIYYVDYGASDDAANGTTTSTAWKRCPGMTDFAGSYSHENGDRFIFKGGVTWPALTVTVANSGAVGGPDYYGVDFAYYTGGSWSRPIFDGGGQAIRGFFINGKNDVTVDNFEFTNYGQTSGMIEVVYDNTGILIENCYFHNWSGTDDGNCINGYAATPNITGVITNCVFDGSPNGTHSMRAVYHWTGAIRNCIARNMPNGFLPNSGEVSGCTVGPITNSNNGVHENAIEFLGGGAHYIFNNTIHDSIAGCICGVSSNDTFYIYNNLFYNINSSFGAIEIDGSVNGTAGGGSYYVYNNTIMCVGGLGIRILNTVNTVYMRNNHLIDASMDNSGATTFVSDYNLSQTSAQASAAGYTSSNNWQPTGSGSPTVGTGTNLTALALFTNDLLGNARPASEAWDIGAYQYGTNAPAGTNAVLQYHLEGITGGGFTL